MQLSKRVKPCARCGTTGHTAFNCYGRQKKRLGGKKYLKKIGKVGRQWQATRREWIQKNLPDTGYWSCTYCGKPLTLNVLTLDHIKSRSRHPELRFELSNLTPACWGCNTLKGSRDWEEIQHE